MLKEVAAVKPTPQVRFNIALCEERLGRLVAALGDYELAASDAQAEKADQVRQEVDSRLESLKARVPRVVVQRGEGADSATISLDGVSLGDSVLNNPLPVDPGPHTVEATALGFRPFKQAFRVAEQQTATIQVKLEPEPRRWWNRRFRSNRARLAGRAHRGLHRGRRRHCQSDHVRSDVLPAPDDD